MDLSKGFQKVRKNVAGFSLAMLISSMFAVSAAQAATTFTDVNPSDWFYTYVEQLAAAGVIDTTAKTFRPADNANRAEAAKLLVVAFKLPLENPTTPTFKDVPATSWAFQYVETAYKHGIIGGYKDASGAMTGKFGPADTLTREQAAKMVVNAAPLATDTDGGPHFSDVPATTWSYEPVETVYNWSVVDGYPDGTFHPGANVNRAQMAKMISNAMAPVKRPAGSTPGSTGTTVGAVTATVATDNPASGTIVAGQATADMLHLAFNGTGTVNSITLMRSGISDQNTFTNVYLYDGANRLTDGYSFNTNGQLTMTNLGLTVSGSRTVQVKADVSSTAPSGQTIALAMTGFTLAGATTGSTANLAGNLMAVASGSTLASVSLQANTVTGNPTVNAGTSSYVFWSAPVQVNTRTLSFKSASFRMIGSAPADAVSNIKLYIDGVDSGVVGAVSSMNGSNYAVFNFGTTPKDLTTGSHTLDVRGDIQKGSNRTVQFSIQNAADLMIADPQVGVNIAVTGTVPNNAATITISTGTVTVSADPTFQTLTNVTGGSSNTVIAKFKLHAYGEDVKVQNLSVTPTLSGATPAAAGLQNVTLYFNGSQVGSQQSTWTSGAINFQLGSQMIVPAGQDSYLEVRADIRTAAGSQNYTAGTVGASLNTGSSNGQGQNSFNTVNVPAGTVTPTTLSIQTGLLAVAANNSFASQNANPNTAGVKIGSFTLQNQSSSESVRVTSLLVDLSSSSVDVTTDLSALRTSETSGSGSTPVQPQAQNTFSVDFTLAPSAVKTIDIFADTGTDNSGNNVVTQLKVASIGVSSNVASAGTLTPGQTITLSSGVMTNPPSLVASPSQTTAAQYITGNTTDGSKATFNIASTGGAATISELKLSVVASAGNPVTSIRVGNVSAPVVNGVAYLTGFGQGTNTALVVPNGGSGLNMEADVSYSVVGTNGGLVLSGTTATVGLAYVKYTSGGTTQTLCTTAIQTCDVTLNPDHAVAGNTMTLVGSKPTVALSLPNGQSGTTIGGLTTGVRYVADVNITADAKGDIKLNTFKVKFNGNASGTTIDASTLDVKDSSGTVISTCTGNGSNTPAQSTSALVTCAGGYLIPAGTTATFKLEVNITAVAGASSSVSTALSTTPADFTWTDVAGDATGTLDSSGIPSFPTSSVAMTN